MNFLSGWVSSYASKIQEAVEAVSPVVRTNNIEVGSTISLRSLDGQIYPCAVCLFDTQYQKTYIKDKHILAVTKNQIVELNPVAYPLGSALVCEVHELSALGKLKFRKAERTEGILILEYKSGKVSKFVLADPTPCVDAIKRGMASMGLGQDEKKATKRITTASDILAHAKQIEGDFSLAPSLELVEEMMSLLRQAAEKFAEANDPHHSTVVSYLKAFLQRDDVIHVLEAKNLPQKRTVVAEASAPAVPTFTIADEEDESDEHAANSNICPLSLPVSVQQDSFSGAGAQPTSSLVRGFTDSALESIEPMPVAGVAVAQVAINETEKTGEAVETAVVYDFEGRVQKASHAWTTSCLPEEAPPGKEAEAKVAVEGEAVGAEAAVAEEAQLTVMVEAEAQVTVEAEIAQADSQVSAKAEAVDAEAAVSDEAGEATVAEGAVTEAAVFEEAQADEAVVSEDAEAQADAMAAKLVQAQAEAVDAEAAVSDEAGEVTVAEGAVTEAAVFEEAQADEAVVSEDAEAQADAMAAKLVQAQAEEVVAVEASVLEWSHLGDADSESAQDVSLPPPSTPSRCMMAADPVSELKPEELKFLESLSLPSPMMSPRHIVSMSEEETFHILSQAVTYHADEGEEELLSVSSITAKPAKGTKGEDSDLSDFLEKLDLEFSTIVESFGGVPAPRSTSDEGRQGYELTLEELEKELYS